MTPPGRSVTDRPRQAEPAWVPDRQPRLRIGFALVCTLVGSWLVAVALIWLGCVVAGMCW